MSAPACARPIAMALPIPLVAPVTIAVFPERENSEGTISIKANDDECTISVVGNEKLDGESGRRSLSWQRK